MIKILQQSFLRLALLGIFLITSDFASGQSIWTNPIDDNSPFNHDPYTIGDVKDAHITVSGIGRGLGISGNAGSARYNAKSWTNAANIDTDDYFTFTLTPNSGYKINFAGLDFTLQRSGTGPTDFVIRSSLDNYTATIQFIPASGTTGSPKTVTLSGASFQNVAGAITFRIYGYGASGATGTASINDFTFNGQVNNALGITDPEIQKISYYPNPVKDILNLSSAEPIILVEAYTLNGQLVFTDTSESTIEKIDLSSLPSGIYFIKASTFSGYRTINIIKQ